MLEKFERLLKDTEEFVTEGDRKEFVAQILRLRRLWLSLADDKKLTVGVALRELIDEVLSDMESLKSVPKGLAKT